MPCYSPLKGWMSRYPNKNGKHYVIFKPGPSADALRPQEVPCGQCIGCRLEKSRQWAMRCVHEAQMHDDNCFITLTYDDENLPELGTLVKKDFQDFMKRLRRKVCIYSIDENGDKYCENPISYYMCGEYGEKNKRPHYHACLFGFDFTDRSLHSVRGDIKVYTSDLLNDRWGLGYATVGELTFESAAYTARYCTKKVTGQRADLHYLDFDINTGELYAARLPEYNDMSRGRPIGRGWRDRFRSDLEKDFITLRGVKMKPPKYYDRCLEREDPERLEHIKSVRKDNALKHMDNNTPERLRVRETLQKRRFNKLKRGLENEI